MSTPGPRIEFLVRSAQGDDFRLLEIPSTVAYLHYRPQRLPPEQCELVRLPSGIHPTATYAVKNRNTGGVFRLTDREKFLWDQMDGRTSIQDLGLAYVLRFGSLDFDIIPELIAKLRHAQLVTLRPASRLREVLAKHRKNPAARAAEATLHALERLTVTSQTVHTSFERLYRAGGFLIFTPYAVVVLAVITLLGIRGSMQLWPESSQIATVLAQHPLVALLLVKLFFWLTVVTHQIVHALAIVHYKRRVREFGFTMLHGFIPTFYADVVDMFMLGSRRPRIVNSLAGPGVHLFLGALYLWLASLAAPGLLQAFLAASAILQLQSFFVSLYPFCFLEMDGYHIVAELLGMPGLNREATHFVRHSLWQRVRKRAALSRQEWAYVGYVVLSTVSVVGFIALNVWFFLVAGRA